MATASGRGVSPQHAFSDVGSYTVVLTVSDGLGTDTASDEVQRRKRGSNLRCS